MSGEGGQHTEQRIYVLQPCRILSAPLPINANLNNNWQQYQELASFLSLIRLMQRCLQLKMKYMYFPMIRAA